jgi:hypothetical protein
MSRRIAALVLLGASVSGCGSRTTVQSHDGPPPEPECSQDSDCVGVGDRCFPVACVSGVCQDAPPVDCDDRDICTTDRCEPASGACSHVPATLDLDGDGYRAPLPAKRAGEPNSCGNDCDDRNASAHPGGQEVCDGVDNDCNGVIDDGAGLALSGMSTRVSELEKSRDASLAYAGGSSYLATYTGRIPNSSSLATYTATLDASGQRLGSSTRFTQTALDAQDGRSVWTGDRYGLAWAQREGLNDYDIYFNIANPDGTKRRADVRITHSPGFSINNSLLWTGNEFVLIWQDEGLDPLVPDTDRIYGQRIDLNGNLLGAPIPLIGNSDGKQINPSVAAGPTSVGLLWFRQRGSQSELMFGVLDEQLRLKFQTQMTDSMTPAYSPAIAYNAGKYVIAWADDSNASPRQIMGTVRTEAGVTIVATKPLTKTPSYARGPELLPYGDRVLLLWSDARNARAASPHFAWDIYLTTLGPSLNSLAPETRLTSSGADNESPHASFGPNGQVGVVYNELMEDSVQQQVLFTRLLCVVPSKPDIR